MKILVIPDSYKNCLSAAGVADAMEKGALEAAPDAEIISMPLSDGGEGFLDCWARVLEGSRINARRIKETVPSSCGNHDPIETEYLLTDDGAAFIESAKVCGLEMELAGGRSLDPMTATSFGLGRLVISAINHKANKIIIGLGGSCTNDGGIGMLSAMGASLEDAFGMPVPWGGEGLLRLEYADFGGLPNLSEVEIIAACDVTNPLCGINGATFVYGPQKGVTDAQAEFLDGAMMKYACICGIDPNIPGSGAAGGLGAALMSVLGADYQSGAALLLEASNAASLLEQRQVDLILTGEGRTDLQTLNGKAAARVAALGKKYGVPVICISGSCQTQYMEDFKQAGISEMYTLVNEATGVTTEYAINHGAELISRLAADAVSATIG